MDIRNEAREMFQRSEKARVRNWQGEAIGKAIGNALRESIDGGELQRQVRLEAPYVANLEVGLDWHRAGAVAEVANCDLTFYVRSEDSVLEIYPIDDCPGCSASVPIGPPIESLADLGGTLAFGKPARGHDCPDTHEASHGRV